MQYLKEPIKYFSLVVHYSQYAVVERTHVIVIIQYREHKTRTHAMVSIPSLARINRKNNFFRITIIAIVIVQPM